MKIGITDAPTPVRIGLSLVGTLICLGYGGYQFFTDTRDMVALAGFIFGFFWLGLFGYEVYRVINKG